MKRSRARSGSLLRLLQTRAAALAAEIPLEKLHAAAIAAIRARPIDEPIAIACSGGADSVALLLLLWAHLPERRGKWLVLHFDHRLRGRASAADARFVCMLAEQLGERCIVEAWRRTAGAKRNRVSEADARDARWACFEQAMRAAGARVIALGHQRDDVAETMLMRLARGSGAGGLAAPRPVQFMSHRATRVRPLLHLAATVLRSSLRRLRIPWREDATNAKDDFFRNRVRRHVLPALVAAAGRDAIAGLAGARELLEEDDAALAAWLDALVRSPDANGDYDVKALRDRPVALARRAVHRWFQAVGLSEPPTKAAVDNLVRVVVSGASARFMVARDQVVAFAGGKLSLSPAGTASAPGQPWDASRIAEGHDLIGPRGDRLMLHRVRLTPRLFARIRAGSFPWDRVAYIHPGAGWPGWLGVRGWLPGDRYRPLGAIGRSKLQDLFVNCRVPRELRPLLPVVTSALGNVLWVPGLPPADEVAIQPAAKLVVQLTYAPVPPIVHRSIVPKSNDVRHRKA